MMLPLPRVEVDLNELTAFTFRDRKLEVPSKTFPSVSRKVETPPSFLVILLNSTYSSSKRVVAVISREFFFLSKMSTTD
nr:hypothetical transcript [Hymenolepis microstoma]